MTHALAAAAAALTAAHTKELRPFVPFLTPGFLLTLAALAAMVYIMVYVVRMKDKAQIHTAFLFLIGSLFIWALGAAVLQYAILAGVAKTWIWAVDFAYVGLILTPVAILYLGLVFANAGMRTRGPVLLLLVVPAVSIGMVVTNPLHHLFYKTVDFLTLTHADTLGPYFTFHTIYSYLCILVGSGILVVYSIKNAGFFSRQSILILLAIVVSFGYNLLLTANVIYVLFHTNVIAFFVSVVLFYFGILRYDLLSVVPIALQRVVDHISDSFLVIDKAGRVIDYNLTFTKTFNGVCRVKRKQTLDELVGAGGCGHEFAVLLLEVAKAIAARRAVRLERALTIDGQEKYFAVEVSTLTTPGDVVLSSIVLFKDVTELKHAMDEVARSSESLMEKERLASLGQMIGGIAHNLKTPIMSIAGAAEGLKDLVEEYEQSVGDPSVTVEDHHEIAREMRGWIGKITPHTAYMSEIITTVKDQMAVSSNETTGGLFTLDELLKRVDLLMKHELKQYHCELAVQRGVPGSHLIRGDISGLVQVFDNLILNAIHAYDGRSGHIELSIVEDPQNLLFAITDHGKGIPASVQEKLFKQMVTTKGKGGTGLGLYISSSTVRVRFGGRIWFESIPGVGTTFHIAIPIVRAAEPSPDTRTGVVETLAAVV